MSNNLKKIQNTFYNALLKLSDSDDNITKDLLKESGINHQKATNNSLKSINKYDNMLQAKIAKASHEKLYAKALEKLKRLINIAPEKTNILLNNLLLQRAPTFQFKSINKWDEVQISNILNELDIIELIEKLDQETP